MTNRISIFQYNSAGISIERQSRYRTTPPLFLNLDLVTEKWRSIWIRIAGRAEAVVPTGHLCSIKNAIVFSQGAILTPDGSLIKETMPTTPLDAPDGPVHKMEGHVALLRKPGDNNYGHWLLELLPRVREFRVIFGHNVRFAIPASPFALREMRLETLAWLGVHEEDVVWLSNDPTQFDEISFITTNSIHSHTHDYTGIRDIVRLAIHGKKFDKGRRFYVARPDALRRGMTNQADIQDMFAKAGFDIVMPDGSFTATEQIDLFRSASVIAGVSGAALTNLMWMRPDTQVLSFNPNLGYEFFFWDLANIMNVRFSLIFGEAVSQEKGVHSDFTVDPLLVKNWLDGLKAN